jgi:hypothetical protein
MTRFVVERINCCWNDTYLYRLPGTNRVSAHSTRDEAEAQCRRLEEEARRIVNPFLYGGASLFYQTSLDEGRWGDWVQDAGLEPPAARNTPGWWKWWKMGHEGWTALEWVRLWEGLDRVRFYRVVERPLRPVLYTVGRINWRWTDDDEYWPTLEGADVDGYRVFRRRGKAENDCNEFNEDDRAENHEGRYCIGLRLHHQTAPLTPIPWGELSWVPLEEAPFWDVMEVEVEGVEDGPPLAKLLSSVDLATGGRRPVSVQGHPPPRKRQLSLSLVLRYNWRPNSYHFRREDGDGGVPLALFLDRALAERRRDELDRAARQEVCPVLFLLGHVEKQYGLSRAELKDRLSALGVELPEDTLKHDFGFYKWWQWWMRVVRQLGDEQREAVWDLLRPGPFHDVNQVTMWWME